VIICCWLRMGPAGWGPGPGPGGPGGPGGWGPGPGGFGPRGFGGGGLFGCIQQWYYESKSLHFL